MRAVLCGCTARYRRCVHSAVQCGRPALPGTPRLCQGCTASRSAALDANAPALEEFLELTAQLDQLQKAINQASLNRHIVLLGLVEGELSQADIAEATNLTRARIGQLYTAAANATGRKRIYQWSNAGR